MKITSSCVVGISAALAGASPVPADTGSVTKGITSAELSKFELFSQYSGATYCYGSFHGSSQKMSCLQDNGHCPLVEAANATNIHPFMVESTRTAGYVATDDANKVIVLSLQGTDLKENPRSLVTNMNLDQIKTDLCKGNNKKDGCGVHGGFYLAAVSARDEVSEIIAQAVNENPEYQIVATGHSLGGALAALVGTMLRNDDYNVDIYTYGQPHVGGQDISSYIQNQAPSHGQNFRITHDNDVVPQLPKYDWGNWGHFYPEFWITTKHGAVKELDISRVDGDFLTLKGNEGVGSAKGPRTSLKFMLGAKKGVDAHLDYFGKISQCDATAPKGAKGTKGPKV